MDTGNRWGRLKGELKVLGALLAIWLVALSFFITQEGQDKYRSLFASTYKENQALHDMLIDARKHLVREAK